MSVQDKGRCKKGLFDIFPFSFLCVNGDMKRRDVSGPRNHGGGESPAPRNLVPTFPQAWSACRWEDFGGSLTSTASPSHKSTTFKSHMLAPVYHGSHPGTLKAQTVGRSFLGMGTCLEYIWSVGGAGPSFRGPYTETTVAQLTSCMATCVTGTH